MHHCIIPSRGGRRRSQHLARLLALALLPLLLGVCSRRLPDPALAPLPAPIVWACRAGPPRRSRPPRRATCRSLVASYTCRSLATHLLQASLLAILVLAGESPAWLLSVVALPLLRWLLDCTAIAWPPWGRSRPCRLARQTLAQLHTLLLLVLGLSLLELGPNRALHLSAVLSLAGRPAKPSARGAILDDGTYEVVLGEQFVIRHKPVDEFDRRLFLLFLRDIHLLDRPSKWPFVCQVWLAAWFGTLQELISRWEDYRAAGDWQRLMSRRDGPLLPLEQQQTILQLWARHLWWS